MDRYRNSVSPSGRSYTQYNRKLGETINERTAPNVLEKIESTVLGDLYADMAFFKVNCSMTGRDPVFLFQCLCDR